jgi:hypothetical protein
MRLHDLLSSAILVVQFVEIQTHREQMGHLCDDSRLELDRRGVPACILGRSLYEGMIDLSALLMRLSDRS